MSAYAKKSFINAVGTYLCTSFVEENWDETIKGLDELQAYLEDENVLNIHAIVKDVESNKRIKFSRTVEDEPYDHLVIFVKNRPCVPVDENLFLHIQIITVSGSPALCLYQSLNNVYLPLLQKGEQKNIQRPILNLQNDLRSIIFNESSKKDVVINIQNDSSILVVQSLDHEMRYWDTAMTNSNKKDKLTKATCADFKNMLSCVAKDFSIIEALSTNEVEDLLEKAHNMLDDLWKHEPPYPKDRMKHLMDIIAASLWRFASSKLSSHNVWTSEYLVVLDLLSQQISLSEKWLTTCKQLTEIFWPNYYTNPWQESVYQPQDLLQFVSLSKEILSIRTFHKQLVKLLTPAEQLELRTDEKFQPFIDADIFVYGEDISNSLEKARKQFEHLIESAERRVAIKLKKQFSSVNANTRQLLYEFSRYSELLSRPVLRQALLSERQYLLALLFDYIKQIQSETISESPVINTRYDIPQIVKEITQVRQLESRTSEVQNVANKLLNDLQSYEDLMPLVNETMKDLKQQHNELFESWASDVIGHIKSNRLSLKESEPVVQFSKEQLMEVNYSPRLVVLISEVRQLKAMGYKLPSVIQQTSEHAKKFMKHARILEQIANFHNVIGDRMIPCLKPMMLGGALELSKLVQEQEVVSWGDERSVEKYVETLKTVVEKLSKQNSMLTNYHNQGIEKISSLREVDLIKEYSKWKDIAKQVRNILNQVEAKGFKNLQTWKKFLDKELALVLEKQYINSLDSLHLYLPEIYVDLTYRNLTLEYSPPEEQLKKMYEQQLKRFLDTPCSFRGISDDDTVFKEITERNSEALKNVTKHTNDLFDQLKKVIEHWQSWIQLESLDVTKLTNWQHWDIHFRASKTFGQETAKLSSTEERVGCFVISLSRLRSDLESHNRSYWDQLIYSLKDSIAQDVVKLQDYINHSTSALTRQPLTIDEIGESGVVHENILKEAPLMANTFEELIRKSKTLSSWTKEQVESVNRIKGAWDRLQSLLENHQHIIEKQMETIRTTLSIRRENMEKELEHFAAKWEQVKPRPHSGAYSDDSLKDLLVQLQGIRNKRIEWKAILLKKEELMNDFDKFGVQKPEFLMIEEVENDINKQEQLWNIFEEFHTELSELSEQHWIVFRKKLYLFDDFVKKWIKQLSNCEQSPLVTRLLQETDKFESLAPLLKYVRGDDFSEKHWMDTLNLLEIEYKSVDQLLLNDFLEVSHNIVGKNKELQVISKKAASEIIVRQALSELDQWDIQCRFTLTPHVDSTGKQISLVKDYKIILNQIGDHQSLLQSIKFSADYDSFADKANMWETKLADLDHYITSLMNVQRKWLYLEPIFASGTLAQEKTRFDRIDRDFKHVLHYIEKDMRVGVLCRYPNLKSLLDTSLDQLSKCQNSLNNFLKEKREQFPRFLFLSDDDLLEVIGQSSKEHVIQAHLKKIFAGINSVKLDESGQKIIAMCSTEGEVVNLSNFVSIHHPIEQWLNVLVKEMQRTLKDLLVSCQKEKQAPDPLMYPSQILCLSDSITFTAKCEQAISSMTLPQLLAKYKTQLIQYSSLELNSGQGTSETDNVLNIKLKALLLDTIHHITVLEELINNNVSKLADWVWQKQLRYYVNSAGDVTIKMANSRMDYSYEYLGNAPKLVQTTLTDRCFLTLTQAIHLGMGGNPYGPAGTGKTESVKALGGLLGRQVLVFNCDEGIDTNGMGRILIGLVKTGAWGCFDEFNRLDEATLSAISMIIHPIQVAIRQHQETVEVLDQKVPVNKHCGIFVTLNPAGGEYGGRNKLPDNLKQLFRPVVMTHPDHIQIAKSLLHCDGYQNANVIATKLVTVYDLAGNLLSKQKHYDFGLRAIKTVLSGCGRALKNFKVKNNTGNIDYETEVGIVMQVLKSDTLSKLSFNDSLKFDMIIRDVFKEKSIEVNREETLIKCLEDSFDELGIVRNNRQINKCLEFYEQLQQRMGVAIVGPPSSGKSTIRNLLQRALVKQGSQIKCYSFNPKSMQRSSLLGKTDSDSNQWSGGVLTNYSLQAASENPDVWSWISCDGDIDPDWVESLNSVLDDNRLLSLPSGWRIQFGSNVNFVFETDNLDNASPATISRIGIVFLSQEDLSVNHYIEKFVNGLPEEQKVSLAPLINDHFSNAIKWITNDAEIIVNCSKIAMTETGLSQLVDARTKTHFCVALINSLGQQLQEDFREIFAQQVFDWVGETPPPLLIKCHYNSDRNIVDSYYTNPNITIGDISNGLPLIYTGQVSQYLDIMRIWISNNRHFLIVGQHGSAKTLMLQALVNERTDSSMVILHCTAHLSPSSIVTKLFENCIQVNAHKGKVLKPRKGNLILHLKNLHLLKPDKWGSNIIIEFLNQLIAYKGFYDTNVEFISVENLLIVGSVTVANNFSKRFISNLRIINVNTPEPEDFAVIISTYLASILKSTFPKKSFPKAKAVKLSTTMITISEKVKNRLQTNKKHYIFSPHDLTEWCNSITRYSNTGSDDFEAFILECVAHEALGMFGHKLVDKQEYDALCSIISETLQSQWGGSDYLKKLSGIVYIPTDQSSNLCALNLKDWSDMVQNGVAVYERDGPALSLVVTEDLLDLAASVTKTLSYPGGHLLLIGKPGTGRRSAVKVASALRSAKLIEPALDTQPHFNNDMKIAMQQSGLEGEEVYLVIGDHIFSKDINYDKINLLISSSEVPDLYSTTELESLVKGLKDDLERENFDGSLIQYFTERVRRKLHVIICLDADNENLWNILQDCLYFTQNCRILWKTHWSKDAVENVPKKIMKQSSINEYVGNNEMKNINPVKEHESETIMNDCYDLKMTCIEKFPKIYQHTCLDVSTPSRYVTMIKHYEDILEEKLSDIKNRQTKLQAGVGKLNEANELVKKLKQNAVEQQAKLEEKQSKANAALDMISNTMKNANTHKEEMEVLKNKTEEENQKLMRRKKEIELELSEVEPLIQQARSAVGNIKSEALSEIRSLRAPPEIIRDILEGVLRLMGIQDTSWNSMKTFLAKRGVKEEIRSFDATRISTENRQAVEKLIANKSDSFDGKAAKRASVAAAPLASWVTANVKYSYVLDKIRPLEREQHKLKQNLSEAEAHLGELSAGLLDVDATVAKLKQQLSDYTKEAAEIEIGLKKAQATLASAEGLVSQLSDEFQRWQDQLQELSNQMHDLPNDCLIAAAFLVYLSNSSEDKRMEILNVWRDKLGTREIDVESFFSTERERTLWQSEGLSSDHLSLQNAIMILKAGIVPLLIDPTSVAVNWIKKHFEDRNIEVTTQNCPKFNNMLELAIRFGKVFIVEEIDDVSPILLQVLKKDLLHQGERRLIKLNGKFMDYHPDFKLILCTRNERMSLPSYIVPLVNLMNFTVTHVGLTEQLLSAAVLQENPDLENRKRQLLREKEELQEKQYHLQNQLLENLVDCKGDILEDKNLLASLNETKSSSEAIVVALKESFEIQDKLKLEYDISKDICQFGSSLFFACNEYARTNILYLLSVPTFTKLFLKALQTYQDLHKTSVLQEKHLLSTVYSYVCRGIFKYDRLKMLLYITHKLYPREIPLNEWNTFLGNVNSTKNDGGNIPTWIPKFSEYAVANLQLAFPELFKKLKLDENTAWNDFMNGNDPKFPTHCSLSEFQKVLVIQVLRPDLLYTTMTRCALNITGLKSLDPAVLDLHTIYRESNCNEPILLLATSGTNSFSDIGELAQKFTNGIFTQIAMGEGLEAKALLALKQCAESGTWLILKNLHLVTYWLPVLTQNLKNLNPKDSFRLWLISEPTPNFYFVLAQNSLKVVYETSQGLKNNLLRTYSNYGSNYIEKLKNTPAKIFFVVSCVHALLQERRKYIPQGWSKPYDFSETDLFTSIKLIEELWNNQSMQIPWNFISGLFSYAVYGGKIENVDDMNILDAYTRQYFTDEILSHRWKLFNLDINLPNVAKFEEYIKCIKQIPSKADPSIFGLPQNIDRAWEKQMSSSAVCELKNLCLCNTITNKVDQNILQKGLTPFMNLWKKLNQGLDFIRISPESKIAADDTPLRIFFIEEFDNALNLIHTIHKSLSNLKKVCKGGIIPDEKDSIIGKSLLNYETPMRWLNIWKGPREPTRFMRSVLMKTQEISKWKNENVETLIQQPLNLSSLFRPEAFLAAHKQTFARSKGATLDELFLEANWRQAEVECLTLKDMIVEGGVLENGALKKCKPDSENTTTVPRCYISWSTKRFIEDADKLEVPLYTTSDKQQKLVYLQVSTDKEEKDKWIQAGLAFYLEL